MPKELFFRIIDQLARRHYEGEIGLHRYNEPLLDKRLPDFIRYARKQCPKSFIYFASNGDLLDPDNFRNLLHAGLDRVIVQYEEGQLSEHMRDFLSRITAIEKDKIVIGYQKPAFWNNRGGSIPDKRFQVPLLLRCSNPDFQIVINAEGKVVLCCNDYFGEETMGDAGKEDIFDIWVKERFKYIRKALRRGQRSAIGVCSRCDKRSTNVRLPKPANKEKIIYLDYINE